MLRQINLQLHARAQSWNWELVIDGETVNIQTLGELSEGGEEGRIEVVDGSRKYRIGDQIFDIGEIATSVLIKNKTERREFDILNNFAKSAKPRDVFAVGRDKEGNAQMTYLLSNCSLARAKKSAFDRKSKTEEIANFVLMPEDVEEVT